MKLSLNWLSDYIKTDLSVQELSKILTDIGLEVEGEEEVQSVKGGLKDLVVGHVLTKEKHPDADRLNVCTVNVGGEEPLQIVCGAPNVDAGQKVIVAPVGSTVHPTNGEAFGIKKAKIRGVESFGMICAEDEIGLNGNHEGIKVLPENTAVGQLVADFYGVETDTVLEIGLTPNRSDANSHLGTARDLAAAIAVQKQLELPVAWPTTEGFTTGNTHNIDVEIEATDACPRYAGVVISNIEIKESPKWMQNRLASVGVKSINNIVDITNFINHEYGQPLHAFDYDKIEGQKIVVKKMPEGTPFTTLDDVERKLNAEDLMICNANEPMCIAGVYGGLKSGVTENTTTIFLESAYFDAMTIRRTELRHNLRTDAAMKFEKGIDPTKQVEVLKRAALLIQELAGGTISSDVIDIQAKDIEPKEVTMSFKRLNQLTGIDFDKEQAIYILKQLEFEILSSNDETVDVKVPLFRADVYREADVIEEVLRTYGFNNVPLSGKLAYEFSFATNKNEELKNSIANHLSAKGMSEMMNNSITRSSYYQQLGLDNENYVVKPLNSLNANLDIMRPDMVMTGLESVAYNQKHQMPNCAFYEFGKTYANYNGEYSETNHLAIFLTGNKNGASWLNNGEKVSFYDLKQAVEEVLLKVGITAFKTKATKSELLTDGLEYSTKQYGKLVEFGFVSDKAVKAADAKGQILFADINFDALLKAQEQRVVKYKAVSKFPSVQRDLALVLDKTIAYAQVEELANQKGGKFLKSINLFNVFDDESKLGEGKKSYAISLTFQNENETLTSKQIDKQMNKLIEAFTNQLGANIRM